jgi:hypothetical protein
MWTGHKPVATTIANRGNTDTKQTGANMLFLSLFMAASVSTSNPMGTIHVAFGVLIGH